MVCKTSLPIRGTGPKLVVGSAVDTDARIYTTPDGQFKSGNYMTKTPKLSLMAELINYKDEEQTVYVVMEIEAVQGPRDDYLDAVAVPLSAVPCIKALFVLSKPVEGFTGGPYKVSGDSYIVNMSKWHIAKLC
jgi:hypothetical protein